MQLGLQQCAKICQVLYSAELLNLFQLFQQLPYALLWPFSRHK